MPIPNQPRQTDRDALAPRNTDRKEDRQRLYRPGNTTLEHRYAIDESRVPTGMVMEWKRTHILGMPDRQNMSISRRNHWTPVTHEMQPQFFGNLGKPGEPIQMDGMELMMRQEYLNEDAAEEQAHETAFQTDQQFRSLKQKSSEQVGPQNTKLKRTYERAPTQAIE